MCSKNDIDRSHTVTKSIISDNLFSSIEIVKLSVSNKIPIKTILVLGGVAFSIDSSIPQHFSKSLRTFKANRLFSGPRISSWVCYGGKRFYP
jgi:hypothetical protein